MTDESENVSSFMTTLDKLENFKRYSLALAVIAIWGGSIALMGLAVLFLIWNGQSDTAIEASKWLIALVGASVTGILGFYFGSNSTKTA